MSNVVSLPLENVNLPELLESNRSNDWPDVTGEQKVFAVAFVEGTLSSAAKKVGVSRERAQAMLRNPLVSAYVEYVQSHYVNHSILQNHFVELELLKTYEKCSGEVDVPSVTKDGEVVWGPRFNATGALAALDKMASLTGMKKEKGVDGHGVTVQVNVGDFVGDSNVPVTIEGEVVASDNSTE